MRGRSPLVRQWILLRALSARPAGATVKDLIEELAVSEKTVRRDLEAFQHAGIPLRQETGAHGQKTWRLRPSDGPPGLSFAFDEAIALYLGRRFLEPLAGTLFWDAAQRAFGKVRSTLSPEALKYLDRFAAMFHHTLVGASDYSKKTELIDQLVMAAEDRRITHITYQSLRATEPTTYDIYPLGIVHNGRSLYLVGWSPQHDQLRHWKVDRIQAAQLEQLKFEPPPGFDLREHMSKSFGIFDGDGQVHVKVRFAPPVARYVQEGAWHASQKLTPQRDGSLVAEFDLSSAAEIRRWLLGFGRHAEVLEPETLRHEMAAELHSSLLHYRPAPQSETKPARQNSPGGPRRES